MADASCKPASLALSLSLIAAVLAAAPAVAAQTPPATGAALGAEVEALPASEVRALQDALIWTGDYSGVVNGAIGSRTRDAIAAYLKRTGSPGAGSLDAGARARLLAEAQGKRQAVGFALVTDKRAGLGLGLPMKLLPKETGTESGTRFWSADGDIVVDTLARPAGRQRRAAGGFCPDERICRAAQGDL